MNELDEWLRHSLALCRSRLNHATAGEFAKLSRELKMREFVIKTQPDELYGSALIWRKYMLEHARLQQARYSRSITSDEFDERAIRLLRWRNYHDERLRHLSWRKPGMVIQKGLVETC